MILVQLTVEKVDFNIFYSDMISNKTLKLIQLTKLLNKA
jgi:hypothetical protein